MTYAPNIPLLRKVVEWAESEEQLELDEKRKWNQAHWFIDYQLSSADEYQIDCGTAFCIAGYVAIQLEGWRPDMSRDEAVTHNCRDPRTGQVKTIAAVALTALGLDDGERTYHDLFEPYNTAARIREIAEYAAGERL